MIEAVADVDDDIMEKYLEGEEISNDELKAAIRKATLNLEFYPVLRRFSLQEQGCSNDAWMRVIDYLPSPLDVKPYVAH